MNPEIKTPFDSDDEEKAKKEKAPEKRGDYDLIEDADEDQIDLELDELTKDLFPNQMITGITNYGDTLHKYKQQSENDGVKQKAEELIKQVTVTSNDYDIDEDVDVRSLLKFWLNYEEEELDAEFGEVLEQRRNEEKSKKNSVFSPDKTVRQNLEKLKSNLGTNLSSGFQQNGSMEEEGKKDSVLDAQIQNIIKKENHKLRSGFNPQQERVQHHLLAKLQKKMRFF